MKLKLICLITLITGVLMFTACSSRPVLPDQSEVKVSRTPPKSNKCESIGPLEGRTMTAKGNAEEALENLKKSAAHKGANFVHIQRYSETGTAVRGEGFVCP